MADSSISSSDSEELQVLIAEVFKVNPEEVDNNLAFGEIPAWDSLGHMDLLMALETRYGVELDETMISELTSVTAIQDYLERNSNGG